MAGPGSERAIRHCSTCLPGRGDAFGDEYVLRQALFNKRVSAVQQINSQEGSWKDPENQATAQVNRVA